MVTSVLKLKQKNIKMNERIQELKKQASAYASTKSKEAEEWRWIYEEKFAELLIKECAEVAEDYDGAHYVGTTIKQHFGVK
jgi:hypothetical protein